MPEPTLPYDIAAERAIIGSCLLEREAIIAIRGIVASDDFYLEKHALIYDAMLDCVADGVPPDLVTVADRLRGKDILELVGGMLYLGEILGETFTAVHVEHYADIVAKAGQSRRLIEHFGQLMAAAYDNRPEDAMKEALQRIDVERTIRVSNDNWERHMIDGVDIYAKHYEPRPFVVEDILPVGVTLLHALPKKRKSWFAQDLSYAVAGGGKAVGFLQAQKGESLYLNLEMDEELLNERLKVMFPDGPPPRGVKFFYDWPRMGAGFFERLENYVSSRTYTRLIVIDTMVRIFSDESLSREGYRLDARMLEQFTKFNSNRGLAILLIHHSRKGGNGGGGNDPVLGSLGSVGLSGSVDGLLQLDIDEKDTTKGRILRSGRRIRDDSPIPITWDMRFGRWTIDQRSQRITPERKVVLELLEEHGPLTPKKVAALLEKPMPSIRRLLAEMYAANQLLNMQGLYALPDDAMMA
jgi:hypothetical protein